MNEQNNELNTVNNQVNPGAVPQQPVDNNTLGAAVNNVPAGDVNLSQPVAPSNHNVASSPVAQSVSAPEAIQPQVAPMPATSSNVNEVDDTFVEPKSKPVAYYCIIIACYWWWRIILFCIG